MPQTSKQKKTTKITGSISNKQKDQLEKQGVKIETVDKKKVTSDKTGNRTDRDLRIKTEEFCRLYTSGDREFFGNGVQSYIEAYQPDQSKKNWYKTACAVVSRMLTNAKVIARINELLEEGGFNDTHVDKELLFLMTQHADFSSKLGAIREYNKLKKRVDSQAEGVVKIDKIEISIDGKPLKNSIA